MAVTYWNFTTSLVASASVRPNSVKLKLLCLAKLTKLSVMSPNTIINKGSPAP